jgi:ribosomal protein L11 methyltransferase
VAEDAEGDAEATVACHPAVSVSGVDEGLVLAIVDDYSPTAAEQSGDSFTIFFRERIHRDAAGSALARAFPSAIVTSREVDDEDWARRSQQNLRPVTVGQLTIFPTPQPPAPSPFSIVIQPSMGFGTGHHATTRLCLAALQAVNLNGAFVLDVGTGSGVLAIAAAKLGAARAVGIDNDPDAIQAARENLSLNPDVTGVSFELADFVVSGVSRTGDDAADVVTANLTGALLTREAPRLLAAVRPGGRLIVSGVLDSERNAVLGAFSDVPLVWEEREDEWVAFELRPS